MSKSRTLKEQEKLNQTPLERLAESTSIYIGQGRTITGQRAKVIEQLVNLVTEHDTIIKKIRRHYEKRIKDLEEKISAM